MGGDTGKNTSKTSELLKEKIKGTVEVKIVEKLWRVGFVLRFFFFFLSRRHVDFATPAAKPGSVSAWKCCGEKTDRLL